MAATLQFSVTRKKPVLVAPAKQTSYKFKDLLDIDDQEGLRFQFPVIQFYRNNPAAHGRHPAGIIKDALAKALVFYYPFAGRLRERLDRKLTVECTGEGVLFIEVDADVKLEQFADDLQPPFPCMEEVLYDVSGSGGVIECPLLLIQFMSVVAEIARGSPTPSLVLVRQRELLNARNPPQVSFAHREYDQVTNTNVTLSPIDDMVHRSFFFSLDEMLAIRKQLPPHLNKCTNFEILAIAICPDPDEEVRFNCIVNAQGKWSAMQASYYGNVFAIPVAVTIAKKLSRNPLGYAVELVRKAKSEVTEEYLKSVADLCDKGAHTSPSFALFLLSDVSRAEFRRVDFRWGDAVYGGLAWAGPVVISFFVAFRNKKGQEGVVVPLCLSDPDLI